MLAALLIIHIICLSISILATGALMVAALLTRKIAPQLSQATLAVTSVGVLAGAMLLLQAPLGLHCLMLSSYVIIFSLAYRFITKRSLIAYSLSR